jgi:uncharacterized protein (TIGR03435 family)
LPIDPIWWCTLRPKTNRSTHSLDGIYDWDLTWTPEPLRHHPPDRFPKIDPEGPSIFTAVQERLGLTLEPQQRLDLVLVIDRVERPTPD